MQQAGTDYANIAEVERYEQRMAYMKGKTEFITKVTEESRRLTAIETRP
jgi:hypothetical protein